MKTTSIAAALLVWGALAPPVARARAVQAAAPAAPPPVAVPGIPPTTPPPALPPPVVAPPPATSTPPAASGATGGTGAGTIQGSAGPPAPPAPEPAPVRRLGPVPTADATAAASDHDAVVGHVGIEARRIDPGPLPLALRAVGCPPAQTTPCEVALGALSVRYWWTRNLAWNGGLALAFGGGRAMGSTLDTHFGVGPIVGVTLLLGNWKHLSVGASPEVSYVWFKPGGGVPSTSLVTFRAALEGELHFGFVGVPALSVGLAAGLGFSYESAPDVRVWSVGVVGAESVWGALSNLFVRYYL